jgi:hypothetical protein
MKCFLNYRWATCITLYRPNYRRHGNRWLCRHACVTFKPRVLYKVDYSYYYYNRFIIIIILSHIVHRVPLNLVLWASFIPNSKHPIMKVYRGIRIKPQVSLDVGDRCIYMVSFTLRPLYPAFFKAKCSWGKKCEMWPSPNEPPPPPPPFSHLVRHVILCKGLCAVRVDDFVASCGTDSYVCHRILISGLDNKNMTWSWRKRTRSKGWLVINNVIRHCDEDNVGQLCRLQMTRVGPRSLAVCLQARA